MIELQKKTSGLKISYLNFQKAMPSIPIQFQMKMYYSTDVKYFELFKINQIFRTISDITTYKCV